MFNRVFTPVAELDGDVLVRRAGLFYRKRIRLADIRQVVAVAKDALTHDEIVVCFFDSNGLRVWLSEFDKNYGETMSSLASLLPGMGSIGELDRQQPFTENRKILWERPELQA